MVTITLISNKTKVFNLPSFQREKELLAAWKAMRDDPVFAHKNFVFKCTDSTRLKVRVPDIKDIFFEEVVSVEATPTTKEEVKQMAREKLGKASDTIIDTADNLATKAKEAIGQLHKKSGGKA